MSSCPPVVTAVSSASGGMFTLSFLLTIGITCALVGAVAVILYSKIQQQNQKLDAMMELSTVLAQEVRSHEMMFEQMSQHVPHQPQQQSQQHAQPRTATPSLGADGLLPVSDDSDSNVYGQVTVL